MSSYEFGKKNSQHMFCSTCGSSLFIFAQAAGGEGFVGVNVSSSFLSTGVARLRMSLKVTEWRQKG